MDQRLLHYLWDQDKNSSNLRKHGIRFADALTVFDDPSIRSSFDPDHSDEEDRWIALGRDSNGAVLVISFTVRNTEDEELVRLISARPATKPEELQYYSGR